MHAPKIDHGTRRTYKGGCACLRCRHAEASYRRAVRQAKAKGQRLPGQLVSAKQVWKMIKALRVEGFSFAEIARRLGLQSPCLQLHPERITVKNFEKVRKFYQSIMLEGPEA